MRRPAAETTTSGLTQRTKVRQAGVSKDDGQAEDAR